MKKLVVGSVAVVVMAGGFLLSRHHAEPTRPQNDVRLQQERERADAESARAAALERDLTTARIEAAEQQAKARVLAVGQSSNGPPVPPVDRMKDPAMLLMMQKQQRQALERRVKQLVNAEMQKKLGLDDAQTSQVRELLKKKEQPAIELMMALMGGDLTDAEANARSAEAKAERVQVETELRDLLGQEGYNYLDWYEKSDTERRRVREYQSQFADAGQPLSKEQEQQLTLAMFEERQKFKFTIDYNDSSSFDYSRLDEFFSPANMERFFSESEQLNTQTLARVGSILTPEQLPEFERLQQEHLERAKGTVRMTHAVFPIRKKEAP